MDWTGLTDQTWLERAQQTLQLLVKIAIHFPLVDDCAAASTLAASQQLVAATNQKFQRSLLQPLPLPLTSILSTKTARLCPPKWASKCPFLNHFQSCSTYNKQHPASSVQLKSSPQIVPALGCLLVVARQIDITMVPPSAYGTSTARAACPTSPNQRVQHFLVLNLAPFWPQVRRNAHAQQPVDLARFKL